MSAGACQPPENPSHARQVGVTVRELRESDNLALEWHGGPDLRSFYQNQWFSHQSGLATVLIADCEGQPAGQAAIYWQGKPTHPDLPDVQSLRVHPNHRGQGIGTQLLAAAEELVRQRGFSRICISAGVENHGARRLYERFGFQEIGQPYDDEWSYVNTQGETVLMEERVVDLMKDLT